MQNVDFVAPLEGIEKTYSGSRAVLVVLIVITIKSSTLLTYTRLLTLFLSEEETDAPAFHE